MSNTTAPQTPKIGHAPQTLKIGNAITRITLPHKTTTPKTSQAA